VLVVCWQRQKRRQRRERKKKIEEGTHRPRSDTRILSPASFAFFACLAALLPAEVDGIAD